MDNAILVYQKEKGRYIGWIFFSSEANNMNLTKSRGIAMV
jgi:hypothetical protein